MAFAVAAARHARQELAAEGGFVAGLAAAVGWVLPLPRR
jgi:hypothetical protein